MPNLIRAPWEETVRVIASIEGRNRFAFAGIQADRMRVRTARIIGRPGSAA
jgi:hypothetical protein